MYLKYSKKPQDIFQQQLINPSSEQKPLFPYTRKQIYQMLKTPPQKGQRLYNNRDSAYMIQYALQDMDQYGYDFDFSSQKIPDKIKKKKIIKNVYLKFQCKNCPDKKFTSIVGTFEIRFVIQDLQDDERNYPFLVKFDTRIYRMKCMTCNQYAYPLIYDSQLRACQLSLCFIVDQIMKEIPPPERSDKKKYYIRENHNHQTKYCEACKYRICKGKRQEDQEYFQKLKQQQKKIKYNQYKINGKKQIQNDNDESSLDQEQKQKKQQ